MAAGIAHEIRNPLASMSGSIQLLRRELSLRDDQATLLDIVLRESQRLNDIIKNFLSYAGPQRVSRSRVDVACLVREVGALLQQQGHGRHAVDRRCAVDAAEPVHHDVDEAQVRQVMWNLASNGLKAMPEGGVLRLGVRGRGRRPAGHRCGCRCATRVSAWHRPTSSACSSRSRAASGRAVASASRSSGASSPITAGASRCSRRPGAGTEVIVSLPAQAARPQVDPILRSA